MRREKGNHVCDWGAINATYMIDEPEYDVTGDNPPQELPYWGSPKWSDEPRSHDPDRSPLFEIAVWFVPIYNTRPVNMRNDWHYFVRVDDNVGSWTIEEVNQNQGCGSACMRITFNRAPEGTETPRSKVCCSNDWTREYPPYREIDVTVEDLNPNSKGIVSIRLEVCVDEATCFDSDPNNDVWTVELDPERMELQRCDYNPTGQPSDRTKWCTFKLNTLSREGWGTVQANHPLKWRIIAQNTVCNAIEEPRELNIYPTFECPNIGLRRPGPDDCAGAGCFWASRGGGSRSHGGIDIVGREGWPVYSPCDGVVDGVVSGVQCPGIITSGYGNSVRIHCDNGLWAFIAHLQEVTVEDEQRVTAGQQIGTVGRTGNACPNCSPHTHWELELDDRTKVDAEKFMETNCYGAGPSERNQACCQRLPDVTRNCTQGMVMCP